MQQPTCIANCPLCQLDPEIREREVEHLHLVAKGQNLLRSNNQKAKHLSQKSAF